MNCLSGQSNKNSYFEKLFININQSCECMTLLDPIAMVCNHLVQDPNPAATKSSVPSWY